MKIDDFWVTSRYVVRRMESERGRSGNGEVKYSAASDVDCDDRALKIGIHGKSAA